MALRKIVVAVDCADDAQRDEVQRIMNEVSALSGNWCSCLRL